MPYPCTLTNLNLIKSMYLYGLEQMSPHLMLGFQRHGRTMKLHIAGPIPHSLTNRSKAWKNNEATYSRPNTPFIDKSINRDIVHKPKRNNDKNTMLVIRN